MNARSVGPVVVLAVVVITAGCARSAQHGVGNGEGTRHAAPTGHAAPVDTRSTLIHPADDEETPGIGHGHSVQQEPREPEDEDPVPVHHGAGPRLR